MQKIATSQAKIFQYSDTAYEQIGTVIERVRSHPKTTFRVVFLTVVLASAFACVSIISDGIAGELKRYQFKREHGQLMQAVEYYVPGTALKSKFTVEQRALAFKMYSCVMARNNYRSEYFCAAQIVSDAAVYGGEQRAAAAKENLRAIGFEVDGWL